MYLKDKIAVIGGAVARAFAREGASVYLAGRIDISFSAIWIRGALQGTPLLEMSCEDFTTPVMTGAIANLTCGSIMDMG